MNTAANRKVPHLPGWPLLGQAVDMRRDRIGLQRRLSALGDLASFRMGPYLLHSVSSAELAHELLVEKDASFMKSKGLSTFARPLLGNGLLTSEADEHRRQRRLLAPAFAPRRLAAYAEAMVRDTEARVVALHDGQALDLAEEMMQLTLDIVGHTLFGADLRADAAVVADNLSVAMQAMMQALTSPLQLSYRWPLPRHQRMRAAVAALDAVVTRVIAARRAAPNDAGDVLSTLLAAHDEETGTSLSDGELRDQVMTLVLAGHETTANALAWAHYLLADHGSVWQRLHDEAVSLGDAPLTYADLPRLPLALQVLKEAMRLYPPAYIVGRAALADVTIGGHPIPKGGIVLVNIFGMHHRADYFADPEAFRPERFAPETEKQLPRGAYLPFGAGARVCIGNHFALMEGQLVLATLARRVRFVRTTIGAIASEPLVTLRPKGGVPVAVQRL